MSINSRYYREKFFRLRPPNKAGFYKCGICTGLVHISEVTIDHTFDGTRNGAPWKLMLDVKHMQPAHNDCNRIAGFIKGDMMTWVKDLDNLTVRGANY